MVLGIKLKKIKAKIVPTGIYKQQTDISKTPFSKKNIKNYHFINSPFFL